METSLWLRRFLLYVLHLVLVTGPSHSGVVGPIKRIKRICKGSDIDLLSERGVKVEPVTRSYVRLDLATIVLSSRSRFQVDFEFKTHKPNGVLFYSRPHRRSQQSIALVLDNGHLKYKIKCPTLHADIFLSTGNETRFNDSKWHRVSYSVNFRHHGSKGHITVDGVHSAKRYTVSCDYMRSVVFGGTAPKDRPYVRDIENPRGHFHGCIRNVRLPTPLQTPPKYNAVSNCD